MSASDTKAHGTGDDVKGKAQETWGKITGDENDQAEGKATQAKGHVKQAVGNVEDAVDDVKDKD